MKRSLLLILVLSICLSLCACANNDGYTTEAPTEEITTPPTTVAEETESEEERMQKLIDYNKALDLLNGLNTHFSYNQLEDMNKAYTLLAALGDYKDVPELLSCFTECTQKTTVIDNKPDSLSIQIYDRRNNMIASFPSKTIVNGETSYKTYTYDTQGRIIRVDTVFVGSSDNGCHIFEYNEEGHPIRQEYKRGDYASCWINEYDTAGFLVTRHESIRYDDGRLYETTTYYTYTLDEMGRVVKERQEYSGKYMELTYTYDEKGRVIEKASYASSKGSPNTYTYAYDESGNVIRESLVREIGGETSYRETTYTYSTVYIYTPPQG